MIIRSLPVFIRIKNLFNVVLSTALCIKLFQVSNVSLKNENVSREKKDTQSAESLVGKIRNPT